MQFLSNILLYNSLFQKKRSSIKTLQYFCNAKINLFLKVNKKNNLLNLHEIETLIIPYKNINDKLKVSINFASNNSKTYFNIKGIKEKIENNTIYKAVSLMRRNYKIKYDITIKLVKKIPIGSGLGGASSNAAFTLIAINKICSLKISTKELRELAFKIGSDVPFFINNVPSIVKNYGKSVTPIDFKFSWTPKVRLLNCPMITKDIYSKYSFNNSNSKRLSIILNLIKSKSFIPPSFLFNDLESIVLSNSDKIKNKYIKLKKKHKYILVAGAGSSLIYFRKKHDINL